MSRSRRSGGAALARQDDFEARLAGTRPEVDPAPVARDHVVRDVETQPGPAAGWLGGVEGLEYPFADLRRHARPIVADLDHDIGVVRARADADLPGSAQGVDRVIQDVRPDLVELAPECLDLGQVR